MSHARTRKLVVAILAGGLALSAAAVGCHGSSDPGPFPGPDAGHIGGPGVGDGGNFPDDARPVDTFGTGGGPQDAPVITYDGGF
jgi:hypothetical protein